MEKPLVDKEYLLEKFPGKGGWTYALIPEIAQDRKVYFGWVMVKGSIDGYEISRYNLMPTGKGELFLPVKAKIRKKIGKEAGDIVHVILFADKAPDELKDEFMLCLKDEPVACKKFLEMKELDQKTIIDWIYASRDEETKVNRIAQTINRLSGH